MAIVEDEVRNESEEENEIEVVVEEDDGDQDSDDSDDEDDDDILERKVEELERRINEDQWQGHYDDHIELIQALWSLSELDRWRAAFDRLQNLMTLRPEHWLLRIKTEITLAHTEDSRELIQNLFNMATADCFSMTVISEWLSWALSGDTDHARAQLDELMSRFGPDPLGGKLLWEAKLELEKTKLQTMSADAPEYAAQVKRVLWSIEECVARPLLRLGDPFTPLKELAAPLADNDFIEKLQKQYDVAKEYCEHITPFEDKLILTDDLDERLTVYRDYIKKVKELQDVEKFRECDSYGILKVLYDRASSECHNRPGCYNLMLDWAKHVGGSSSSRSTCRRVLQACTRRCPRRHDFWTASMDRAELDGETERIKEIFEMALAKGMASYKEAELLWLSYLEYIRRTITDFGNEEQISKLRATFRLAWDSLAEAWGEEANDCEVPLYWARLEYRRVKDYKQGKEIFEEMFNYGENKTMSKYWESLISLELSRHPMSPSSKLRALFRRAIRFVTDYPPAVARLWTDYERDYGERWSMQECRNVCDEKLQEWRENYQKLKEKMTGEKQKGKQQNKQQNKKSKFDNKKKKDEEPPKKGKRKSDQKSEGSEVKKKKDGHMEVDEKDTSGDSGGGVKRSHDAEEEGGSQSTESKRQRTESEGSEPRSASREASTLFVSNLEFKVDEQKLRDELSKYGEIVSMRVKSGVKAFGGSICYCQYKTPESVDEAIKHDRTPIDGRPMFLSRYSSKKTKQNFKYATTAEKNKLFVKNLPYSHCTRDALTEIFNKNGKLKDVRIVTFKDGKPKGLAYIEYEDEASAEQALKETNGTRVADRDIEVLFSSPPPRKDATSVASLGQPKRDPTGGMRRTQVSFIPSVLQKASTSKAPSNGEASTSSQSNGDKRPLSNADFRSLLLK